MKTKALTLCIAMLVAVSAWADEVYTFSVYEDCSKNGYEAGISPAPASVQAVDLGLPSGIKWASCNVGATQPEDYGNYYAWGEVFPKDNYTWITYKYANGSSSTLTKYCNDASYGDNGFTDNKTTLDPEDDAAHFNWGGNWRMPTGEEIDELLNNCTWKWTTQNGVNGYKVTSNANGNSNSIFLPAAGYCNYMGSCYVGSVGGCWSSLLEDSPSDAWYLSFYKDFRRRAGNRCAGQSVRPVCSSTSTSLVVLLMLYADGCENPNVIHCNAGQQINLMAVPTERRQFVHWADGNTDNPRLVTVTKDMALTAEFAPIRDGQCGDNLYWKYAGHTLTISGSGDMYDYSVSDRPWLLFCDTIDAVVLESGITHIGNNAFNGFEKLNKIELPNTLTSIGQSVFAGCRKLYDIYAYPIEPPVADNSSFANYNVNLYVPCDNLRAYQMDAVFGSFKYIQCITTTANEQVQSDTISAHVAQKLIHNGHVYILRNGNTYTLTGEDVKSAW